MRALPLALALAIVPLQKRIDDERERMATAQDVLYVWSGERLAKLAPGIEDVLADIYWLRTVQYFGLERIFGREQRFDLLKPLIEITTGLDPRMEVAYRYGAIYLAERRPTGAQRPDDAIDILVRGVRAQPDSWRLRQDLGYFWFIFKGDPGRAARILESAAHAPGAPYWLRNLAADVLRQGGDREATRQVWRRIYEQAANNAMRFNALAHLRSLDSLDAADAAAAAARGFRDRAGRLPADLDELHRATAVPIVDAAGVLFHYDPKTGAVSIDPGSSAWRP